MAASLLNFDINPVTGEVKLLPYYAGDDTPTSGEELAKRLAVLLNEGEERAFWVGHEDNHTWICLMPPNEKNPHYHLEIGEPCA